MVIPNMHWFGIKQEHEQLVNNGYASMFGVNNWNWQLKPQIAEALSNTDRAHAVILVQLLSKNYPGSALEMSGISPRLAELWEIEEPSNA